MPTRCASNRQGACSALKLHFQHWTIFAWGAAECLRSGARAEQIPSIPGPLVFLRCLGSQPLVGKKTEKTESHPTLIFFDPLVHWWAALHRFAALTRVICPGHADLELHSGWGLDEPEVSWEYGRCSTCRQVGGAGSGRRCHWQSASGRLVKWRHGHTHTSCLMYRAFVEVLMNSWCSSGMNTLQCNCEVKTVPDFIQEEPAKAPVGAHRFWPFWWHPEPHVPSESYWSLTSFDRFNAVLHRFVDLHRFTSNLQIFGSPPWQVSMAPQLWSLEVELSWRNSTWKSSRSRTLICELFDTWTQMLRYVKIC